MSDQPLYSTAPTAASLGSTYHVYADRVELHTTLYGRALVPLAHVVRFAVCPPLVPRRGEDGAAFTPKLRCLRPDMAAFVAHVGLERATGPYRLYRFAAPDPAGFVAALQEAMRARPQR